MPQEIVKFLFAAVRMCPPLRRSSLVGSIACCYPAQLFWLTDKFVAVQFGLELFERYNTFEKSKQTHKGFRLQYLEEHQKA